MSDGVARVPVLPRRIAAGVSVFAVTRTVHGVAGGILIVSVAGVIGLFVRMGIGQDLADPLTGLGLMIVIWIAVTAWTNPVTLAAYVVVGGLADFLFLYGALHNHHELLPMALVIFSRPATALVLVGTSGYRPLPAVGWGLAGFASGSVATILAEHELHIPLELGHTSEIMVANYCALFLGLAIVQRVQERQMPDFLQLRYEARRMEAVRSTEQHAVALLHDTVLNDLALVINGPEVLDERITSRLREDIATLANTSVLEIEKRKAAVDASDGSLRNRMTMLVSDFQWRGLTVEFTGDTGAVAHMTPEAITAAVGAMQACLENVLRHSGTTSAEIVVSSTWTSVTWTVTDAGTGFDLAAVPEDRLGLRSSVFGRVESEGGMVKVWTSPGNGTSVLFTLPLLPAPTDTGPLGRPT